jgi:hypothetical protein
MKWRTAGTLVLGLLAMRLVGAHHGDAGRYEDKLTTVTGKVVELQLINPHAVLVLEVADEQGNVVRWRGELGSAVSLKKQWGWTHETIKVGDVLTITGRRLKNGQPVMTLSECSRVVAADGRELFRGNAPGQPSGEPAPHAGAGNDPCAVFKR